MFLGIILRVLRLEVPIYKVYITYLAGNSKEENSSDFCLNYIQEFDLGSCLNRTKENVSSINVVMFINIIVKPEVVGRKNY
jgi:hypothetical protein